jgi:hypothetical protein
VILFLGRKSIQKELPSRREAIANIEFLHDNERKFLFEKQN